MLKALIALLAIKDGHLLDEMRAVLFVARRDDSPIGDADAATWAHIRKELSSITDLIGGEDARQGLPRPAGPISAQSPGVGTRPALIWPLLLGESRLSG